MVSSEKILVLKLLNKMRVVGGFLKGKKINVPLDKLTRPLKDLVRESVFNILKHSKEEYVDLILTSHATYDRSWLHSQIVLICHL